MPAPSMKSSSPFARRFQPDLILVSAGYDAHWDDPLAMEAAQPARLCCPGAARIALADELCAGRLVMALEGGYHLQVLAHAVLNTLRILENVEAEISDPFGPARHPERNVDTLLANLRALHRL